MLSLKGYWQDYFTGLLSVGREAVCLGVRHSCAAQRAPGWRLGCSISAHGMQPPSWIAGVHCTSAHSLLTWASWRSLFTLGTLLRSARSKASAHGTLWASETRLSTKETKVRFYFVTQVPTVISWELLMGFAGDTWLKRLRYVFE